ncbi:DNA/RNA non-specific endonuclease [Methylobacter sp. YRD-M1]|uniref:DNA/RNA non-specific endonuclease n=1 Tax=Methylobacter sp. YRD-M1 TaxID=2911520 RepID=UPI00227CE6CD|nr:DNA/RNA non-specific endonuclease [Methylobacter sp. YRD-M1]WAK02898.1 DNA/RNA non-specific endonuclease [Methylobacter sp. YRD-M1]
MRRKPHTLNWLILLLSLFRIGRKHPLLLLTMIFIGAGGYAYEVKIARPALLFQGAPQALNAANYETWFRILRNDGFILGYSDLRGNPLWVEYVLTPPPDKAPSLKRPNRFETDWRSINRVSHDSYQQSGYDRGHMAPNYAISRLYGKEGQADSFLMTNISPQKSKLNQRVWQRLEEVEIQHFAKRFGKVWVITGPVFSGTVERLTSDWTVEIPDAFYKIYIAKPNPNRAPIALGFLIPQTVKGKEPLMQFVTTIDHLEAQTGLDFFPDLDDKIEAAMEASADPLLWDLPAVSKLPPRY